MSRSGPLTRGHRFDGRYDVLDHMHDYLTIERGLHNLLWVYEADKSAHGMIPVDYYYPGDDYVDVAGHNLYSDDWVLSFDANEVFRAYPKVYAFPQAGPKNQVDGSWTNPTMMTQIRSRYPRASMLCAWDTFTTWKNGQSVLKHKAIVDNAGADLLMHDPWAVTRDDLPF